MKFVGLIIALLVLVISCPALAQPRFGVEMSAGQAGGLTSYIQNVGYTQEDQIFLADEVAGVGLSLNLAFIFDELELSVTASFLDRSKIRLHHQANEQGPLPDDRIRPDGTIDDAGFTYRDISPVVVTVPDRSRGALLVATTTGGWRYYLLQGDVDIWVPFAAGVAITHILEDTRPWTFGLATSVGLGFTFDVAKPIAIYAQARVNGILTPSYGDKADASRTSAEVGESTWSSAVSTMLYTNFGIGIQIAIR